MKQKIVNEYIIDALFELLKTKEIGKITVSELVEKAGVCRSSFYRNYFLLEDVVKEYIRKTFYDILSERPVRLESVEKDILEFFSRLSEHKERFALLEKRGVLYLLDDVMFEVCRREIINLNIMKNEYYTCFFSGASSFVIRLWVRRGFVETPEEISKLFIDSFKSYSVNVKGL